MLGEAPARTAFSMDKSKSPARENPIITLNFSRSDDGLEHEVRLFERYQEGFYLSKCLITSEREGSSERAEYRIEADEYRGILEALLQIRVSIVPAEVPLQLGPHSRISIAAGGSLAVFSWGANSRGWEALAEVAGAIRQLQWKYTQQYE